MKIGDKVKYTGVRRKEIIGQIGIIIDQYPGKDDDLRRDEYTVDFGFEDDCEYYLREKQLELVNEVETK